MYKKSIAVRRFHAGAQRFPIMVTGAAFCCAAANSNLRSVIRALP